MSSPGILTPIDRMTVLALSMSIGDARSTSPSFTSRDICTARCMIQSPWFRKYRMQECAEFLSGRPCTESLDRSAPKCSLICWIFFRALLSFGFTITQEYQENLDSDFPFPPLHIG